MSENIASKTTDSFTNDSAAINLDPADAPMEVNVLTLELVIQYALPLGTVCLAGGDHLRRVVRWAVTINPAATMPYLEGGELILIAPSALAIKDDITDLIRTCADAGAAGVVSAGPISSLVIATADILGLPLLQLPTGSHLRELERAVIGLLLDGRGAMERRSTQIYEQLVSLASENVGLDRIVHELSRFTGKSVVLQDKNLRIIQLAIVPALTGLWDDLSDWLIDRKELPNALKDRHKLSRHTSATVRQMIQNTPSVNVNNAGALRMITPIITQNVGRGYLSFVAPAEHFSDLDQLIIDHAAVVCALEMARAKAISEIEKKLRGDFLDSLMTGTVGEAEALAEGDRFGHDMNSPHVAIVMTWYGGKHPSSRRLETLVNGAVSSQQVPALVRLRENELRLFLATDSASPIQAAREVAEDIRNEAKREYPDAKIAIGIGVSAARVNDWRGSYRDAAQAAEIARRLQSDAPMFIGDLGIYTFLARPEYKDDLRSLRDSTIGALIQYEERQRADLLLTLEAFFQCHGNHTQTAELLSVHRNTLFYRMNRIAEITGLDLNRPDVRLAVHLALKIHRLLTADV